MGICGHFEVKIPTHKCNPIIKNMKKCISGYRDVKVTIYTQRNVNLWVLLA